MCAVTPRKFTLPSAPMSLRSTLKSTAEWALSALPYRPGRGDRLVLAYHNVVADGDDVLGDRSLHLAFPRFTEQLREVRNFGDIVPLSDLVSAPSGRHRLVAVTFDDAYSSALRLGVAYCGSQGIPTTTFVSPSLLGSIPVWDLSAALGRWLQTDRDRFLREFQGDSVRYLAEMGETTSHNLAPTHSIATAAELLELRSMPHATVGNHTYSHINASAVSLQKLLEEISACRSWLLEQFPTQYIDILAYPYGLSEPEQSRAIIGQTVQRALLVNGGAFHSSGWSESHRLPRWNVPSGLSARGFRARLKGWVST